MSIKWWLLIAVWAFLFSGTLQRLEAGEYRIGVMPSSNHVDNSKPYNEDHSGLLLELRLDDDDWFGALTYENSFYRQSNAYYWLREYPITDNISWGHILGGVTGYKDDRMMLYGSLTLTLHFGHAAARLVIIPTIVTAHQAYWEF